MSVDAGVAERLQPQPALVGRNHPECYCLRAMRWTAVKTHSQAERWANANLLRQGYETYLPMLAVLRRDRVMPSMQHRVDVPLFPGYVFVKHDPQTSWGPIRDAPGVKAVLRFGNQIAYAQDGAVEQLQASEDVRRNPREPQDMHRPGEACRLVAGPFCGHDAVIVAVKRRSAIVSLVMMGSLRRVNVQLNHLEAR